MKGQVKEDLLKTMVTSTRENGRMTVNLDSVFIHIQTVLDMKEIL